MQDLLKFLNDKQREAVTTPLGPVLVLAGAGSGKTRVLTYRMAYLLQEKLFRPQDILSLTFTNKAAGEMRERIERLLFPAPSVPPHWWGRKGGGGSGSGEGLTMGTFHSVCARLLRADIEKLGLGYGRNFVIYDSDDSGRLLKQIVMELGLAERFRPQVFAYYISTAKNRLLDPAGLALDNAFLEGALKEVYTRYQQRLAEHNALDFDDLLKLVCELLSGDKTVLKKYQERFKYILVDEYQDTNHVQYVLLNLLVKKHHNLFVVGDDAQSIYGFRGANMQNILDFKKDYPKARVIMLEQNYRSTQNILDAAAEVIKLNPMQYEKKLWTENLAGQKLNLYEALDEVDEAQFVLQTLSSAISPPREGETQEGVIETAGTMTSPAPPHEEGVTYTPILDEFMKNRRHHNPFSLSPLYNAEMAGVNLNDIVILYRTHAQSRPFEEALLTTGIPYQIVGGIKFYERKEVKDVLSYLRLLQNPKDLVSLARVINVPPRGLGAVNFREILGVLPKYDYNYARLAGNLDTLGLRARALAGATDFFELMVVAAKLPKGKSLAELMDLLLKRSGYKDSLLDGDPEGANRWENIEELMNVAARYKKMPWGQGLQHFLEEVSLMTDLDTLDEGGNKLTLMTLHSAKGLEFENVFLVGLEEGLLPHSRSLLSPQELAEEIRLAYVGMTRAKRNLYLSYARQRQTYGELKKAMPSRILKAIPKKLIRKISNF